MHDELQQELDWINREIKRVETKQALREFKQQIIAKEHARLRALFEKKIKQDNGCDCSGCRIEEYNSGVNDCLSELGGKSEDISSK